MSFIKRIFYEILTIFKHKRMEYKLAKYPQLRRVYSIFENSPQGKWIIGKNDVLNLYKLILETKPAKVLELGTGIGAGTAVIAMALNQLGRGSIISLEQSPEIIEIAQQLIEQPLKERLQIVCAKPVIFKIEKLSKWKYFSGYDWLPANSDIFDFVVIDGPGRWLQDGELIKLDNGDIVRFLPYFAKGCKIYIDGRRATVEIIKRYLSKYFIVLNDTPVFTLLEKNERQIRSLDELEVFDIELERSRAYLNNLLP